VQQFIQMVTQNLGISEGGARSATGALLRLIQSKADTTDFQQLLGSLPGADGILESTSEDAPNKPGGMLGGVLKNAVGMTGGSLGSALGAAESLAGSGLEKNQIGSFVSMFMDFAKQNAGGDLLSRILGKVPELKQLMN
jgi:hypothetical protein